MKTIVSDNNILFVHSKTQKPQKTEFTVHKHIQFELFYFISGNANYVIGNLKHKLEYGDLIVVPSLSNHYVEICGNDDYERIVIDFYSCNVPDQVLKNLFIVPRIINIKDNEHVLNIYSRFIYYNTVFSDNDRNLLFNNLLTELIYLLSVNSPSSSVLKYFDGHNTVLHNILQYIDKHLLEIDEIDTICNQFYISRPYLHKLFSNTFKLGPMKYITNKRLILARDMIHIGEKPSHVYLKVGFNDYTVFYRAYKAFFHCSPSQDKYSAEETP